MMAATLLLLGECCHLASVISGSCQPVIIGKPVSASPTASLRLGGGERPRAARWRWSPSHGHCPCCFGGGHALVAFFQASMAYSTPGMIVRSYAEGDSGVQVKTWGETGQGVPCHRTHVGAKGRVGQGKIWAVIKVGQMPQLIPQEALEMGRMTLFQTERRGPGFHWIRT